MNFALLLLLAAAPVPQSWQFETDGSPEVSISNVNGSIRVEATDGKTVSVDATQEGSEAERAQYPMEVTQDGDEVTVRMCCGDCSRKPSSCNNPVPTHFVVKVPRKSSLDVSSVAAQVKVSGVKGELEVASVSGDVELAPEALEDIEVSTVSGNVKLKLPRGAGASVDFSSVGGRFNGRSVNLGSREQRYGNGAHSVDVNTVSGSLDVQSDEDSR